MSKNRIKTGLTLAAVTIASFAAMTLINDDKIEEIRFKIVLLF